MCARACARVRVLFLCSDANTSQWSVQVDLTVDANRAANMQIVLSVPELDSQQTFQTRFLPGKTKNSFSLNIKMVILPVSWMHKYLWFVAPVTLFCHQSSPVRLWWPNGYGDQPSYHLNVTGFLDGFLVLKRESKVRETALLFCLNRFPCML